MTATKTVEAIHDAATIFNDKMVRIMDTVGYIQKDSQAERRGSFGGYKYASAEAVLGKVREMCVKEGVSVTNEASLVAFHVIDDGKKTTAVVKIALYFTDGTFTAKAEGLGQGIDSGDKATMKANTAAMKYACSGKFLISWGDDPEKENGPDVSDDSKLKGWLIKVSADSSKSDYGHFKQWWPDNKAAIIADCGQADATKVHRAFTEYLDRLKQEVHV